MGSVKKFAHASEVASFMISIVIPVFNSGKYITQCINSIVQQNYKNFEILCIDDGSTDNSLELLRDLQAKEPRLKIFSKKNEGASVARNLGIEKSSGEYILFVDSDDLLVDGALEILLDKITKFNVDAVIGQIILTYEVHENLKDNDMAYYRLPYEGEVKVSDSVIFNFHSSPCGILFKKKIIENFGITFPPNLHYEDAYWHWIYFSNCKSIYFTKKAVYHYFRHPVSTMSDTFNLKEGLAIEHLYIAEQIFNFWKKNSSLDERMKTATEILESYFWFSIRFSKQFEKAKVAYEARRIICKFNLDVSQSDTLRKLLEGHLHFLYPNGNDIATDANYGRYLQILSIFNKWVPANSARRKIFMSFARKMYKILR